MSSASSRGNSVIVISVIVAMILTLLPLPFSLEIVRPEWVLLVLIFWSLALPERIGILIAVIVGLVMDGLLGNIFGLHSLLYALVIFVILGLHKRIRLFPTWKQMMVIFLLTLLTLVIKFWILNLVGLGLSLLMFLWPAITTALVWPLVLMILKAVRSYFRVGS